MSAWPTLPDVPRESDMTNGLANSLSKRNMGNLLIYGANGYTGSLIAREAARRGIEPLLAGRNAEAVSALARELGLATRVFDLGNPALVDTNLRDVSVVLHCAGPFARTFQPMADACLRTKTHYLDITGEENVFETLAGAHGEAQNRRGNVIARRRF